MNRTPRRLTRGHGKSLRRQLRAARRESPETAARFLADWAAAAELRFQRAQQLYYAMWAPSAARSLQESEP